MNEPCPSTEEPPRVGSPAGLSRVAYRGADFRSVRRTLLRARTGETALGGWRPGARNDLLLLMLEWWAYLADSLAVYDERTLNESLLGTAADPASVTRLVALLGHRPRLGTAAAAQVGILLSKPSAVVPAGFGLDNKPPPGATAQRFELAGGAVAMPDAVAALPPGTLAGPGATLTLAGSVKDLPPGDLLLLTKGADRQLVTLATITPGRDAAGRYTRLALSGSPTLPSGPAAGWTLLRSDRSIGLWRHATTAPIVSSPLPLEAIERTIAPGDPLVLTAVGAAPALAPRLLIADAITEATWFMNGDAATAPTDPAKGPAIPAPLTRVAYAANPALDAGWSANAARVRVLLGWRRAGTLRDAPVASWSGTPAQLIAVEPGSFKVGVKQRILIEGADGVGVLATADIDAGDPRRLQIIGFDTPAPTLTTPLTVLANVMTATRGKTVEREILGSGDAAATSQSFTLAKAPLTRFAAGDGVASTLMVQVDGVRWDEVTTFFGQPPDATVYVTRDGTDGKTRVTFGDGENGRRLPTGQGNVVARYRHGSDAQAPATGTLTILAGSAPGVRGVRSPVVGTGAGAGEAPETLRRDAPRSVLTFGRAVAADDYATIAARAPGVVRVRASYDWSAVEQRAIVTLHVGDSPAAVAAVRSALVASADPNRPFAVQPATRVPFALGLALRIDRRHAADTVIAAVRARLTDGDGLFGPARAGIGRAIHMSEIAADVQAVAGVVAIADALVLLPRPDPNGGSVPYFIFGWVIGYTKAASIAVASAEYLALDPAALYVVGTSDA